MLERRDASLRRRFGCRVGAFTPAAGLSFALEKVRARSKPASWACFEGHLLQKKAERPRGTRPGIVG